MKTLNQCKIEIAKKYNLAYYGDADVYERANKLADEVAELYASQFNKPPVYGQWIDVKERLPEPNILVLCVDHRFNRMMVADWMDYTNQDKEWFTRMFTHWTTLPPSPGSVDVDEKKEYCDGTFYCSLDSTYNSDGTCGGCGKKKRNGVYGLGDSSGSAENQEQLWKEVFHQSGSRMDFMQFLQKHFTITRKP